MVQLAATKSIDTLFRLRKFLFACAALGIGSTIGVLMADSSEAAELTSSLLVIGLFLLLTFREPFYALLVWLFLSTFIDSWVEVPMGAGVPDLSFNRFALFFLAIALLLPVVSGRRRLAHLGLTDLCVLLIPIAFALSAPSSVQPMGTIQTAISMHLIPASVYFFAKNLVDSRQHLHKLLWVIAVFGIIAGAYALYESLTGNVFFLAKDQVVQRLYRGDTNLRLIVGLVGSTSGMGRVLATTLLVTFYLIFESRILHLKPLLIIGAALQLGGLLITYSRTPILAFLFGLFLLQFFYPALRKLLLVLAIVIGAYLGANWNQIQQSEVAEDRLSNVQDYNGRSARWDAGLRM